MGTPIRSAGPVDIVSEKPERPQLPLSAVILIGALAVFGALAAIQWLVGAVFGVLRLGLVVIVIVAIAGLVFWGGPERRKR
jgi:hypothetical protein